MATIKRLFPSSLVLLSGLVLFVTAGPVSASNYDVLVAQLQQEDWHSHFSDGAERTKLEREFFPTLIEVANNKGLDWRIRMRSIRLLSETANPGRADVLMRMFYDPLFNDECPAVKTSVVTALGNIGRDERVADALIRGLSDRELQVREEAIRSLGRIGSEKAVPNLLEKLNDRSFAVRLSTIRSLALIKDRRAVPFLRKIADGDQDALLKNEARKAIEKISS